MTAAQHWTRVRGALVTGFVVALLSLTGLLVVLSVSQATGTAGFLLGLTLAVFPLLLVLWALRWLDRFEPEPPRLVLFMVAWGATVAALVALVLNTAGAIAIARATGDAHSTASTAVLVAPWVEEAAKGAALLLVLWFRRAELDGIVDGLVLGGLVGVGFAFTENVLYFGKAFLAGEGELGMAGGAFAVGITFFLRGVLSPFAHPLFTAMMGLGVAFAANSGRTSVRWLAPLSGYLLAVALHAAWNWASIAGLSGFFAGYASIMVPVFGLTVGLAAWSRRREGSVIATFLPPYVAAGWLSHHDVSMLASTGRRRQAEHWAQRARGPAARRAVRTFASAATELAFLRHRLSRGQAVADFTGRERALLQQLSAARRALQPPPR